LKRDFHKLERPQRQVSLPRFSVLIRTILSPDARQVSATAQTQSTAFPHAGLTLCKTCEKLIFFVRKVNGDSYLQCVEKKFVKTPLIYNTENRMILTVRSSMLVWYWVSGFGWQ